MASLFSRLAPRSAPVANTVPRAGGSPLRSHHPAGYIMAAALVAAVVGFLVPTCLAGCAGLTPSEGALLEGAVAAACPEEAMVPVVGAALALACPGEEAAVKALVDSNTVSPGTTVVHTAAAKKLVRTRGGKTGCIGIVLPKTADAGSPVTVVALPMAPAVLPVVDAGAEAGR